MSLKCLLIFGQKFFGKDNQALIDLGDKIKTLGVEVSFAHWDNKQQCRDGFSISQIVIPHSFGIRAFDYWAPAFPDIKYVAAIDPAFDWFPFKFENYWKEFYLPPLVEKADCFQRDFPLLPPSGKIKNEIPDRFVNFLKIKSGHDTIPNDPIVVDRIIKQIGGLL